MAIDFTDYERITDIILYLSPNITLNFTTVLARKDKQGSKIFFHYETEYQSKFIGTDKARAIKRNMTYYFTIDNKNDFGNGLILRPQDIALLNMIIAQKVLPWFFDPNKRLFSIVDEGKRLAITGNYQPVLYAQSEYKYLQFDPIIISFEDNTFKEGIRLSLNNSGDYVDLDIDRFMGFVYTLKNTDMYSAACNQVNYVKSQPYGLNVFSMIGLGGGSPIQDNWSESEDVKQNNSRSNTFLDGARKK